MSLGLTSDIPAVRTLASRVQVNHILVILSALLVCSAVVGILHMRAFYADGSYLFYRLLWSQEYVGHSSRFTSLFLTQTPLLVSLKAGVMDIRALSAIYNTSVIVPPVAALLAALWLSRNSMLLLASTAIVIAAVYYPIALCHIGEFHLAFTFGWLALVALLSGARFGAALACLLGVFLLAPYEAVAGIAPLLVTTAMWQRRAATDLTTKRLLGLAALIFLISALLNFYLIAIHWGDDNAGTFREALFQIHKTAGGWIIFAVSAAAAMLALLSKGRWRSAAVPLTAIVTIVAIVVIGGVRPISLGLGNPYILRSTALVVLLLVMGGTVLFHWLNIDRKPDIVGAVIIGIPVLAAFGLDNSSTRGWTQYLESFCRELAATTGATAATQFHQQGLTKTYGWIWTNPALSVVLRPADSHALILNQLKVPGLDDTSHDISRYKANGSLCGTILPNFDSLPVHVPGPTESRAPDLDRPPAPAAPAAQPPFFTLISFAAGGQGHSYLGEGWSHVEDWGVWSDGSEASLRFRLNKPEASLQLRLRAQGFEPDNGKKQPVTVLFEDRQVASLELGPWAEWHNIALPLSAFGDATQIYRLRFLIGAPTSPAQRETSSDARLLGIGLSELIIQEP